MTTKIRDLSPEAQGLLRALQALGRVRHFDKTGDELLEGGLARMHKGALELSAKGKERIAKAERKALR